MVRRLILMRHAKAEPYASTDHARTLTGSGRTAAGEVGKWLSIKGYLPDAALVSSSARTRGTWDAVAATSGSTVVPDLTDALYNAGPEAMLAAIQAVSEEVESLMVVGHNPTVAYLANVLGDGEPDPDAFRRLASGFPTSAVAVLAVPTSWASLAEGDARLVDFHVGLG